MEGLLQALKVYQTYNPPGWVGIYRLLPMWAGLVCCGVGLVLLLFGGGRVFRLLAGPAGALLGLAWTGVIARKLGLLELDPRLPSAVAALLAVVGFLLPPAITVLGIGIPLGLLVGEVAGSRDFLFGFIPAFLLAGLIGAILHRMVSAVVASAVGAWLLVIGALAALNPFVGLVATVSRQPWAIIAMAALFALAGSVYQIAVRPSPEQRQQQAAERERLRLRKAERQSLEKRWGTK